MFLLDKLFSVVTIHGLDRCELQGLVIDSKLKMSVSALQISLGSVPFPTLLSSELLLVESGRETAFGFQPSPSQFPKLRFWSCWLIVCFVSFQVLPLTSVGGFQSLGNPLARSKD